MIPMVVAVAFLMEQLDSTIITTAIPDVARTFGVSPVQMSLAVAAYVLTVAVFIPISGWLADRFGARRIFVLALAVFTLGSALCGASQTFPMLVFMRILQGLGGAMMTPVGRLILLRSFPRSELITAMTYMSLPAIVGPVLGPLLGGVLTTYLSWRWIFYVNLPFGLAGMLLAMRFIENTRAAESRKFYFGGFLAVGCGLGLLQFGIENLSHPSLSVQGIAVTFTTAATLLVGFVVYAKHVSAPIVDLDLFRIPSFRVGTLAGGLCRIGMNGVPYLLPLMLQLGFGLSPIASGSITFVGSAGAILIRGFIAPLIRRFGFKNVLAASAVLGSIALAGFSLLEPATPHWMVLTLMFGFGLTRSVQFMASNTLSYSDIPDSHLSLATSMGGILQQLSVSFGVSMSAVLLGLVSFHAYSPTSAQFHQVFLITAVIPLLSLLGFVFLKSDDGAQSVLGKTPFRLTEGEDGP